MSFAIFIIAIELKNLIVTQTIQTMAIDNIDTIEKEKKSKNSVSFENVWVECH